MPVWTFMVFGILAPFMFTQHEVIKKTGFSLAAAHFFAFWWFTILFLFSGIAH